MKKNKLLTFSIAGICVLNLIVFFIIGFYTRPCADDFTYSYRLYHLIQSGNYNLFSILKTSIDTIDNFYHSWQGTYSSAFIMSLQPGVWGEKYYCVGVFLLIIFMYICLYRLFKVLNKYVFKEDSINVGLISLLYLTFFLQTVPYIVECIYWLNGSFHYEPFFFLTLVVISYVIEYYCETDKDKKTKAVIMSSIFSFIISGGNQVTSFFNILVLVLAIIYAIYRKKDKGIIITLLVAAIGFIIMFMAPGNNNRIGDTVQTAPIMAILNSFKGSIKYAYRWFGVSWIAFIILNVILFEPFIKNTKHNLKINPIIIILITYCLYAAMFCPTNYAMSTNGPKRAKNVIYFALILFSIFDVIYTLIWLKKKTNMKININNKITIISTVLLLVLITVSTNNNALTALKELQDGTARNFAMSFDKRVELIKKSKDTVIEVEKLPDSIILKFDDISEDINDWQYGAWNNYYQTNLKLKTK